MENQHREIKGYRELSPEDIALMNEVKALEAKFNGIVDRMRGTEMAGRMDQRQVSIAQTDGESAFMRLVRAIAQPERLSE